MSKATGAETTAVTNVTNYNAVIKSIQVFPNADGSIRYRTNLDIAIPAMKKDYETETYAEAQVDYIDFVPRVLIAQVINLVEGVDLMYTKKKEQGLKNDNGNGFGAAELQVILRNAKLTIERTKFEVGDEYTTSDNEVRTHENAGYNTNITAIKVSERVQVNLDKLTDSIFDM